VICIHDDGGLRQSLQLSPRPRHRRHHHRRRRRQGCRSANCKRRRHLPKSFRHNVPSKSAINLADRGHHRRLATAPRLSHYPGSARTESRKIPV